MQRRAFSVPNHLEIHFQMSEQAAAQQAKVVSAHKISNQTLLCVHALETPL